MLVLVSAFVALSFNLSVQPTERITDWREAVRCLAAFETAASKSFAEQAPDAGAVYDDQAMALFASMGERFDFARMEQAETIRARSGWPRGWRSRRCGKRSRRWDKRSSPGC